MRSFLALNASVFFSLLTRKTAVVIFSTVLLGCFVSVAASGYIDFAPDKRDLYKTMLEGKFLNLGFLLGRTIFVFILSIVTSLYIGKGFTSSYDHIYLTGGINRSRLMIAKIISIFLINISVFLSIIAVNLFIMLVTNIAVFDIRIIIVYAKLCISCFIICSWAALFVMIFKSSIVGLSTLIIYYSYMVIYDNLMNIEQIKNDSIFSIINGLFPLYNFTNFCLHQYQYYSMDVDNRVLYQIILILILIYSILHIYYIQDL